MANHVDLAVAGMAGIIGEPARARILFCLMDGRARTSTELAAVAHVSPGTASIHLNRLRTANLISVLAQGKYRYYCLAEPRVAEALEALAVLACGSIKQLVPSTPSHLRDARSCYDHMAGRLAVLLHNRFKALGWLVGERKTGKEAYEVTMEGGKALACLGVDLVATRSLRRRFAFPCLDWSERQPHIGGALGAALLNISLKRKWVISELDSRTLNITRIGRREIEHHFGCSVDLP